MKTIREELIDVRNKLDKLIKQLGTEIVLPTTEKSLENTIFNPRVLKTEKDLYELRQTIANYISGRPTKDEKKILQKIVEMED